MDEIQYSIRRSERARRARIVVEPGGVEVVIPRRMALRHVAPFVDEKRAWIERTVERLRAAELSAPAIDLRDGGTVPYLGEALELRCRVDLGRVRPHVARRADRLEVRVARGSRDALVAALSAWYRRQARDEVAARLDASTRRAGKRCTALSIRSQRTRWASCSSKGAMSFNWRLLLAPPEILDYVVEHEVAHLDVLDHSRRFWALLAERCPRYREHERWLRRYGPLLRLA